MRSFLSGDPIYIGEQNSILEGGAGGSLYGVILLKNLRYYQKLFKDVKNFS